MLPLILVMMAALLLPAVARSHGRVRKNPKRITALRKLSDIRVDNAIGAVSTPELTAILIDGVEHGMVIQPIDCQIQSFVRSPVNAQEAFTMLVRLRGEPIAATPSLDNIEEGILWQDYQRFTIGGTSYGFVVQGNPEVVDLSNEPAFTSTKYSDGPDKDALGIYVMHEGIAGTQRLGYVFRYKEIRTLGVSKNDGAFFEYTEEEADANFTNTYGSGGGFAG